MALLCGPRINNQSCIDLKIMVTLVKNYNMYADENNYPKIKVNDYYETNNAISYNDYLFMKYFRYVRIFCKCLNLKILKKQPFYNVIKNEINIENILKEYGPHDTTEWLTTFHIDNVMKRQQQVIKFWYFGAVPMDFASLSVFNSINKANWKKLLKDGYKIFTIVFNLDNHNQSGSHWVCLYANFDDKTIYYFDSVGREPEERVCDFINILKKEIKSYNELKVESDIIYKYNKTRHQKGRTECGVYCIFFLSNLIRGIKFNILIDKKYIDSLMESCRLVYFKPDKLDNVLIPYFPNGTNLEPIITYYKKIK